MIRPDSQTASESCALRKYGLGVMSCSDSTSDVHTNSAKRLSEYALQVRPCPRKERLSQTRLVSNAFEDGALSFSHWLNLRHTKPVLASIGKEPCRGAATVCIERTDILRAVQVACHTRKHW